MNKYLGLVLASIAVVVGSFLIPHTALGITIGPQVSNSGFVDSSGTGTIGWSTILAPFTINNANSASVSTLGSGKITRYIKFVEFNFSIPSNAIIDGITANIVRRSPAADSIRDVVIALTTNSATTTSKADTATFWPTTFESRIYGGSIDNWDRTWTAAEINDPSFGLIVSAENTDDSGHGVQIDGVTLSVDYTLPPEPTLPVLGCIDPTATNFNPLATEDDGSCVLPVIPEPEPDPVSETVIQETQNTNTGGGGSSSGSSRRNLIGSVLGAGNSTGGEVLGAFTSGSFNSSLSQVQLEQLQKMLADLIKLLERWKGQLN